MPGSGRRYIPRFVSARSARGAQRNGLFAVVAQRRQIVWIDLGGRTRVTIPCADPNVATIMAKMQLHSQADVQSWFEGPDNVLSPSPAGGAFPDVVDLARLTFTDAAGGLVQLALPAPSSGIFLADSVTVDPSAIADIITACVGHLCTGGGALVTAYVSGIRNLRSAGG